MVTTRGARNNKRSADDAENAGANGQQPGSIMLHSDSDSDEDYVLEQVEQVRKRRAKQRRIVSKKRRVDKWLATHPPIEVLPVEVLQLVFLFLDNARDVYNLVTKCGNKHVRSVLTPEIVIRSSVFAGGHVRKALKEVIKLIKDRAIHIPSDQRLLRLACGTLCERGEHCFNYHRVNKVPKVLPKHKKEYIFSRPFGLCICDQCAKAVSSNLLPYSWRNNHFAHQSDRVVVFDYNRLLCRPQVETATGEKTGPVILGKQIKQIEHTYKQQDERTNALNALLQQMDQDAPAGQEARLEMLVKVHETAESQYDAFENAKRSVVWDREKAKREKRTAKKNSNMQRIYEQVSALMEGYAHKDIVLECEWRQSFAGYCPPFVFRYGPSEAILGRLVSAPSSATQKKITDAVELVKELYDLLFSNGFLGGTNFLSFSNSESRLSDTALHEYCVQTYSWMTLLRNEGRTWGGTSPVRPVRWTGDFLDLLRSGKPMMALVAVLEEEDKRKAFVLHAVTEEDQEARRQFSLLASRIWRESENMDGLEAKSAVHQFCARFDYSRAEYVTTAANARDYLAQPATGAFLAESGPPNRWGYRTFTRRQAVDKSFESSLGASLLRDRDFTGLLALHHRCFESPEDFGYSRW